MEVTGLYLQLKPTGTIDQFESLIWTDRYDRYGDFELYTPVWESVLTALPLNNFVYLKESEHAMIVETRTITTDQENGDHLKITGRSLESMLSWRIIQFQLVFRNANLQSVVQQLLESSIMSGDMYRVIPNFIFQASTDPTITALVWNGQYYGETLYEAIQAICEANGLGFKIVINSSNQFVFSLYRGVDRSYGQTVVAPVIFSPKYDNLVHSEFSETTVGKANVARVFGEGTGINKFVTDIGIDTVAMRTGLYRREMSVDAADISTQVPAPGITLADLQAQMNARGYAALNNSYKTTTFDGAINPVAPFTYLKDFFIGDTVQIENEYGMTKTSKVVEAIYTQDPSQTSIIPTFKST